MFNKKQIKNFKAAKIASMVSDFPRVHIGVVVTIKNNIIAAGCNKRKTHPMQKEYNKYRNFDADTMDFIHAEVDALLKVKNLDLRYADVYVYRELHNGKYGMARPCVACMWYIKSLGIRNIYYTTDEGFAYEKLD